MAGRSKYCIGARKVTWICDVKILGAFSTKPNYVIGLFGFL